LNSIRLSLVFYFLLLSAAALGTASWFVYQSSFLALRDSEETKRDQLRGQYAQHIAEAKAALDKRLLSRAYAISRLGRWSHDHVELLGPLGALTATLQPQGHLGATLWLCEAIHPNLAYVISRNVPPEISFDAAKEFFGHGEDSAWPDYFQVNLANGEPLERSESLGGHWLPLVHNPDKPDLEFKGQFDDVALEPGVILRRVTLKVPVRRYSPWPQMPPQRFGGWGGRSQGPGPGPAPPPRRGGYGPGPLVYIQYAAHTATRDAALAGYREAFENDLEGLAVNSRDTLAALRYRFLWVGLITFAALAAGGLWLVGMGLAPLKRLSEAVSRVSPRDFRLQLEERRLPLELRGIASRLKQTLELLQRAFAREKQAAADISHELRTPLAALLTTLDVGLRKTRSAEEYRALLEECRTASQHMSHLVERLLALARLDAGVDHLRLRDVDAAAVAEQCAALVRPLADARDVSVRVNHQGPVRLQTDPDKLGEILTNLLHNAIQYNRPRGTIDVAVERCNGTVNIAVQDSGIGVAPDAKEHIFERFFRADPSRHADDLHAGLGLAIVKGYIDLMGGTITVDSTPEVGSTFRLSLPAR
jgi:heavy metal sensor kinase